MNWFMTGTHTIVSLLYDQSSHPVSDECVCMVSGIPKKFAPYSTRHSVTYSACGRCHFFFTEVHDLTAATFNWYPIFAQPLIAVISRYMALLMRKKTYTNMTTVIQRVIDAMTRCESIPTKVFPCRPLSSSDEINSIFKWRPIVTQLLVDKMLHSGIFIHMYTCSIITTAMCQIFHTKFSK